jgi:hypothetical protein
VSVRRPAGARLARPLLAAAAIGVGVAIAARVVGGGSCPAHEALALGSSCRGLIASLAVRVGVTTGVVVLFAQLVMAGLARTAEAIDRDRALAEEER